MLQRSLIEYMFVLGGGGSVCDMGVTWGRGSCHARAPCQGSCHGDGGLVTIGNQRLPYDRGVSQMRIATSQSYRFFDPELL